MVAKKKQNKSSKGNSPKPTLSEVLGIDGIKRIMEDQTTAFIFGVVILVVSVWMFYSFFSYFSSGAADQSLVADPAGDIVVNVNNLYKSSGGSLGALVSYYLISRCWGVAAFVIPFFLVLLGLRLMGAYKVNLLKAFLYLSVIMIWSSVALSLVLSPLMSEFIFSPGGDHGDAVCQFLDAAVGTPGTIAILIGVAVIFMAFVSYKTVLFIQKILNPTKLLDKVKLIVTSTAYVDGDNTDFDVVSQEETSYEPEETIPHEEVVSESIPLDVQQRQTLMRRAEEKRKEEGVENGEDVKMSVEKGSDEVKASGSTLEGQTDLTPINPKEPFLTYKYPTLDLLAKNEKGIYKVTDEELQEKKDQIVEVLESFSVKIKEIRATIGPTITLYEIKPAEGVRISKIKNLEDDIALSLSALGVRIIAPIPGKGTIGIEVPNTHPNIVPMESILNTRKFKETTMELPIALGKTITNEVFMIDLAKMPHLLVAGATGQGKSVGLNAIITSLLYKKHPNELKFVLVDPKKVEFSVYAPIADHFMAVAPPQNDDVEEEPIITDVSKVVRTLNSLCALMDYRYDLLKMAAVRNIKEYNAKFLNRRLNPEKGHDYMPYIVAIVDEFGDLIMTAGKEVELPIARIAQLARAVGIHMVIATQRPTTSIITGNIKANFPGRISFKVSAGVDSKTILDRMGAQQLVGRGDMLYLNGGEPVRVQCAFIDTPEVERVNQFICSQCGPTEPMLLPEPPSGDSSDSPAGKLDGNLDPMFEEVCRFVVAGQQGSTSNIQRHFSIGYNRAGRLMDQLQKAGVVGEAQGSKPRKVLIQDEVTLATLLQSLR